MVIDIWPENVQAFDVFSALATQWRPAAGGGVVGLDYAAIRPVLQMMQVKRSTWPALFSDIRVMELAARAVINKASQ